MKCLNEYNAFKKEFEERHADFKLRAANLFAGDISREAIELEAETKHLERERQELEEQLNETEAQLQSCGDEIIRKSALKLKRQEIKSEVKALDKQVIDIEAKVRDLKNYNAGNFYGDVGIPQPIRHSDTPELEEVKKKTDIVNSIVPPKLNLTSKDKRGQRRDELNAEIARLKKEKADKSAAETNEEDKRRVENMFDDEIEKNRTELQDYL